MYLLKPEEGFCIPVLYIKKEELDISRLEENNQLDNNERISYFRGNIEGEQLNQDEDNENEQKQVDEEIINEEVNNRLVFDTDESIEIEEIKQLPIERIIKEIKEDSVGVLILDEEDIEENKEESEHLLENKENEKIE